MQRHAAGLDETSRFRDVVEFFGEAFEAFVFAAEHDGKGVGGCRYQKGNVGQNVLRLALKQQVIAKRAKQNERQQHGFNARFFADKQQIDADRKHDVNNLHLEAITKPEIVKPLGYPLLVTVYDDSNNIEQAISTSQEFLAKYSNSYLAPYVMENMARLYELSSKQEEANKVYKDIVDKFPQTVYANRASKKLK